MSGLFPNDIAEAYRYLMKTKVRPRFLLLVIGLSTILAFLNLYIVTLLFPLVQGVVARDFTHIQHLPIIRNVVACYPRFSFHPWAVYCLLVLWVYLLMATKSALGFVLSLMVRQETLSASKRMRIMILDRFLNFGKLYFDRNNIASLVWQATNCYGWIEGIFIAFQWLMSGVLELLVYFAIMMAVSWRMTLSVLLVVPLFRLVQTMLGRIRAAAVRYEQSLNDVHAQLTQLLSSLPLVQTSGQTRQERQRFDELCSSEASVALRMIVCEV